jgi:hypothetical protein
MTDLFNCSREMQGLADGAAALAHTGGRMNVTARGHQKPVATSYQQRWV